MSDWSSDVCSSDLGPQRGNRFRAGYRDQSQGEIDRRRARLSLGLVEELAYPAEILDIASTIGAVDKVTQETIAIAIAQGPVNER